jgi:hypothetical protein
MILLFYTSLVTGITGMYHHAQPLLVEIRSCEHFVQAGLEL